MNDGHAYVISDLHLGCGPADPGLEDFVEDARLGELLERIAGQGVTLFVNGDFIDFPQVPPYEVPPNSELLWPEAASLHKLRASAAAHPRVFESLGAFAKVGTLVFNIGNHDLDLGWPRVQQAVRTLVGGSQVQFNLRSTVFRGVHIEHGHEFTPENALIDPEVWKHERAPDERRTSEEYLERVWGTDFVLSVFNDLERRFPFADNAKPTATVLFEGFSQGWIGGAELVRLVLFLKRRGIPLKDRSSRQLSEHEVVELILDGLVDKEWRDMLRRRSLAAPSFGREIAEAWRQRSSAEREILRHRVAPELGVSGLVSERAGTTRRQLRDGRERRAATERLQRPGVTHVVFGHTHRVVDGELEGRLYNPGSWIPTLDLESSAVQEKIEAAGGLTLEILNDHTCWKPVLRTVEIRPGASGQARVELVKLD